MSGLSRNAANKCREHLGDLNRAVCSGKTEKMLAKPEKGKLETKEGKKGDKLVTAAVSFLMSCEGLC